jgi:hypothetical protein
MIVAVPQIVVLAWQKELGLPNHANFGGRITRGRRSIRIHFLWVDPKKKGAEETFRFSFIPASVIAYVPRNDRFLRHSAEHFEV